MEGAQGPRERPASHEGPGLVRVFTFDQMHALAAAAGPYEPMIRVLSDCGLRLGELLPLERRDLDGGLLHVRRTAHEGQVTEGTKTNHGEEGAGRVVPLPATLQALIRAIPSRIDTPLLFPTKDGAPLARAQLVPRRVPPRPPHRRARRPRARASPLVRDAPPRRWDRPSGPGGRLGAHGGDSDAPVHAPLRASYDQIRGVVG